MKPIKFIGGRTLAPLLSGNPGSGSHSIYPEHKRLQLLRMTLRNHEHTAVNLIPDKSLYRESTGSLHDRKTKAHALHPALKSHRPTRGDHRPVRRTW